MRRPPGPLIAASAFFVAACSSGDGDRATEVADIELLAVERPFVNPVLSNEGSQQIAFASVDGVCVLELSDELAPECVDREPGPWIGLAWSPDGSAVAFHQDAFRLFEEPDIHVLDVDDGTIDVVADDGVDSVGPDADVDVAPFFDTDGTLHFFRTETGDEMTSQLMRFDDGEAVPIDGAQFDGLVDAVRPDAIDGTVLVRVWTGDENRIVRLDPTDGSSDELPARDLRNPQPVIAVGGRTLVIDRSVDGDLVALLVEGGTATDVEPPALAGDLRALTGVGLSPDGDWVAAIVSEQADASGAELFLAPIAEDGTIGDYRLIATGGDFPPTDGDEAGPAGLGLDGHIAWVGDRLVTWLLGQETLALIELD